MPCPRCSWRNCTEALVAISMIVGVLTRWGGVPGALMTINLWLGHYFAPGEWPWT